MIYAMFFLAIAEGIRWFISEKKNSKETECHDCTHEHNHEHAHEHDHNQKRPLFGKKVKKFIAYAMVLLPTLTGILLPISTLDSNLVDAKGFQFPTLEDANDQYGMHQILNPDMSKFMGKDGFTQLVNKEYKSYKGKNHITLTDEDYLQGLEVIYNFAGNFQGKTLTMKGFTYNGPHLDSNQIFLFRFGMIHCVADSGVFGMLIQFPNDIHMPNDQWYQVTGTVDSQYYAPFKMRIPVLKVTDYKTIGKPKDPYVYRNSFN
jgi:putative membrane protein